MADDWLSLAGNDLLATLKRFDAGLPAALAAAGLTDGEDAAGAIAAFAASRQALSVARTAAAVALVNRNAARAAAVGKVRRLAAQLRAAPGVGPDLLGGLGLKPRDTKPTAVPAPDSAPLLIVTASGRGQHTIAFSNFSDKTGRKPRGAVGIELYVAPPPVPAANGATPAPSDSASLSAVERTLGAGWRFVNVLTRSPQTIVPTGVHGGDLVRYIARWRTAKGLTGPWSETVECTLLG